MNSKKIDVILRQDLLFVDVSNCIFLLDNRLIRSPGQFTITTIVSGDKKDRGVKSK